MTKKIPAKLISLTLVLCFLIPLVSCKKKSALDLPDDTPLLIFNGETLMDVSYFRKLYTEMNVSNDILGTAVSDEKELFIHEAEVLILSRIAEMYHISADTEEISEQYDEHMEEIADESSYPGELTYFLTLRDALNFQPSELKQFVVEQTYHDYNVTNVIDDISDSYLFITDKDILLEYLQINILEIVETSEVEIGFPGVQVNKLTFMDVLEEH